ncbi:MAG: type II secretion system protein [Candidatus Riflebacteria bacterium]|nr:type II secretion system protein [Candidatus Riflebacteria bacterium]
MKAFRSERLHLICYKTRRGFSLVEILVVLSILAMIVGGLLYLMTGFHRSFAKGEESTIVLQEAGFFLAHLRNDLINAVQDPTLPADRWSDSIIATPDKLTLRVFRDTDGNIEPIEYQLEGDTIKRSVGGRPRVIVDGHVASLSWKVESETLSGLASGVRRIWVTLSGTFGGKGKPGIKSKTIPLIAKLFPTRLNRRLNGS